jgi:hypothetical protein
MRLACQRSIIGTSRAGRLVIFHSADLYRTIIFTVIQVWFWPSPLYIHIGI